MVAKVLLIAIELLVVEIVGKTAGEDGAHGEAAPFMVASLEMVHLAEIFLMVTRDSSSGRFHVMLVECSIRCLAGQLIILFKARWRLSML